MPGKMNWKIHHKQLMNSAVWREYKTTAEKRMREIIKQPFTNIESKVEKIKRAKQEASKVTFVNARWSTPV